MFYILFSIVIYFTIGAIVWFTEDVRFAATWQDLFCWPSTVITWIDMAVEKATEWLDRWSG